MIRMAVTDLETFRYWKANEESTMDDLIARLTHREVTVQMRAGGALAKVIEDAAGAQVELDSVVRDGFEFVFDCDAELPAEAVRELRAERMVTTPYGDVRLVARCDMLNGLTVRDQKLTERWDAEKYLDSLQWRAYLDIFDADAFVYDVFEATYEKGKPEDTVTRIKVTGFNRMTFYRYPDMRKDVESAVCELAEVFQRIGHGIVA